MTKAQKKKMDEKNDINIDIAADLMRGLNLAKQIFGDNVSTAVAISVYESCIDDDEDEEGVAQMELARARDIAKEMFGDAATPEVILDLYATVFLDDDQVGAHDNLQVAHLTAKEVYGETSPDTVFSVYAVMFEDEDE